MGKAGHSGTNKDSIYRAFKIIRLFNARNVTVRDVKAMRSKLGRYGIIGFADLRDWDTETTWPRTAGDPLRVVV